MLRKILDKVENTIKSNERLQFLYPLYDAADTFLYSVNINTLKAPFVRDSVDLKRTMVFVLISLIPSFLFGTYNVGYQNALLSNSVSNYTVFELFLFGLERVLPIYIVTLISGGTCEAIFAVVRKHEINEGFLVTWMLIPLLMPPTIPLWMVAVGTIFGVVIGKEVFGGTGFNIFNPALVARAFIFFAYPGNISGDQVWIAGLDGRSSATPLLDVASQNNITVGVDYKISEILNNIFYGIVPDGLSYKFSYLEMFYGFVPGSIGETSALAALIGALFLIITRIASVRIILSVFLGMIGTSLFLNFLGYATNSKIAMLFVSPQYHFVMGSFAFGTIFMATEPVTAAHTSRGKIYYGVLIGALCVLIRCVNPAYPEGMMLAILFANGFAPLFDYFSLKKHIKDRKNG